jgi:hypothetical protein
MPISVLIRWQCRGDLVGHPDVLRQHLAAHLDRVEVAFARDDELVPP